MLAVPASVDAVQLAKIGKFEHPTYITSQPEDAGTIFVVELRGTIEAVGPGPGSHRFLDLRPGVDTDGEGGLWSMAFSPDFASSGLVYVLYAERGSRDIHLDEFVAQDGVALPSSQRRVLSIEHPWSRNHFGGQLQFGPDGYLYVSVGDGAVGSDPQENAQDTDSLHGKLLRIDPAADGASPYTVPADNPFAGAIPGADEVWSFGLRNPWRFSFDRLTGALVVADVGELDWEEANYEPATDGAGRGVNFGWDCRQGAHDFDVQPACTGPFTDPEFEYPHSNVNGIVTCAITGGYISRDPGMPELEGRYVYADFCSGQIRSVDLVNGGDRSEQVAVPWPVSFGEDACGRLYLASAWASDEGREDGAVYRLVGSSPQPCPGPPGRAPERDPAPDADDRGPALALGGEPRQRAGRRLEVIATVDEPATAEVDGEVLVGRREKSLFQVDPGRRELEAGVGAEIVLKLDRRDARECRRAIEDGRRVAIRFSGAATDATGNRGPSSDFSARLVLE